MNLSLTEAAFNYIQEQINKENGIGFRLTVKKTGCSGYAYHPEIIKTISSEDLLIIKNGLSIYVDNIWSHLLDGIQIDYIEEIKTGLKQKKLLIHNPHEAARCGCGESFHVKTEV